tara:strand:+ start:181 stop:762 length:582 start_codon:yes stop_codon:yes gene_type:complete
MSIATLKRKTLAKYNNSSVNTGEGFSLNGTHRNQGYVGQTSLSRSLPRTLMKGNVIRGHGGCCGTYNIRPIVQSGVTSTEDNSVVKKSVMNTRGMIDTRFCNDQCNTVKPDSGLNANTQGELISRKQKESLLCDIGNNGSGCTGKCSKICLCTKPTRTYMQLSGSDYTYNLRHACVANDIKFVPVSVRGEPTR